MLIKAYTLCLEDILNVGENISIIDIGFSETVDCNMIIFARIIVTTQAFHIRNAYVNIISWS